MSSWRPATPPMPSAFCRCSSARSRVAACRRRRNAPMAAMQPGQSHRGRGAWRQGCRLPQEGGRRHGQEPQGLSQAAQLPRRDRAGIPAPSEPTVWHAAPGAGSITSRPASGPRWWRTTWCCSPASNRHNPRPRPAASIKVGQITRPVHPRSPNDSFDLCCYCNAKAAATADNGPTLPFFTAKKYAFMDGPSL
jgi:hypothetical protein